MKSTENIRVQIRRARMVMDQGGSATYSLDYLRGVIAALEYALSANSSVEQPVRFSKQPFKPAKEAANANQHTQTPTQSSRPQTHRSRPETAVGKVEGKPAGEHDEWGEHT